MRGCYDPPTPSFTHMKARRGRQRALLGALLRRKRPLRVLGKGALQDVTKMNLSWDSGGVAGSHFEGPFLKNSPAQKLPQVGKGRPHRVRTTWRWKHTVTSHLAFLQQDLAAGPPGTASCDGRKWGGHNPSLGRWPSPGTQSQSLVGRPGRPAGSRCAPRLCPARLIGTICVVLGRPSAHCPSELAGSRGPFDASQGHRPPHTNHRRGAGGGGRR